MNKGIAAPGAGNAAGQSREAWGFAFAFWLFLTPFALTFTVGGPGRPAPLFGPPEILLGAVPWAVLLGRLAARHRRRVAAAFSSISFRWVLRIGLASLVGLVALRLVIVGVDTGDTPVMVIGFSLLTGGLLLISRGDSHHPHRRRRRRRHSATSLWP